MTNRCPLVEHSDTKGYLLDMNYLAHAARV